MPRNLELKVRVSSLREARQRALLLGAVREAPERQVDTYYAFVREGRLKLRRSNRRHAELIYYRRPNRRGTRTSSYSRIGIADEKMTAQALRSVLDTAVEVRKRRQIYLYRNARIHLDRVQKLGTFLEFEVQLTRGPRQAGRLMQELRRWFHIRSGHIVSSSYADLLQSHHREYHS